MTEDTYHTTIDPISRSQLSAFYEDPEQFKLMYIDKTIPIPEAGRAAQLGKVFHAWLLEDKPITMLVREIPENCLKTNGAINRARLDEFSAAYDNGIVWVKPAEYERMVLTLDSARRCVERIGGRKEREIELTANIGGVRCKMRADLLAFVGDGKPSLHDFKFSPSISDRDFLRSARKFRYWLQDAHYSSIVAERFKVPMSESVPFTFWTVETEAPYRVWPREIYDYDRQRGHEKWRKIIESYRLARNMGEFESHRSHKFEILDWELEVDISDVSEWSDDQ